MQELSGRFRPDVVVECGVAHGGALVLYASVLELLGKGRVVGVDVEIRKYNRLAIESHALSRRDLADRGRLGRPGDLERFGAHVRPSDGPRRARLTAQAREHVAAELEAYAPLVSPSSYFIVFDGVISVVADVPTRDVDWETDNPLTAVEDFLARIRRSSATRRRPVRRHVLPRGASSVGETTSSGGCARAWRATVGAVPVTDAHDRRGRAEPIPRPAIVFGPESHDDEPGGTEPSASLAGGAHPAVVVPSGCR